jgi:hypothetical protein
VHGTLHQEQLMDRVRAGGAGGGGALLYPRGQCTWYVATRRPDLPYFPGKSGDALNWIKSARRVHLPTGDKPRAAAVAVFQPQQYQAGRFGHVAYVESVQGDEITISEANFKHRPPGSRRTIEWAGLRFVYKPGESPPPPPPPAPPPPPLPPPPSPSPGSRAGRLFAAPGTQPTALTWDGNFYWVGDYMGTLFRLDANGTVLDSMAAPPGSGSPPSAPSYRQGGLSWTGGQQFAVSNGGGSDSRILNFLVAGSTTQMTSSFATPATDELQSSYMTWDGAALWFANGYKAHQLSPTGAELAQFSSGQPIRGIAWDGAHFWLTHPNIGSRPETVEEVSTTGAILKSYTTDVAAMGALTWVNGSLLVLAGTYGTGYAIYKLDVAG